MKNAFMVCLLMVVVLATRTQAQTPDTVPTAKHWAVITFNDPVKVGRQVLMGTYLVVHDDAKMSKGEQCTTIYRFDPKAGPKEQVVAFMCVPKQILARTRTTLTVLTDPVLGIASLQGFEFAGESELHGVPADAR